MILLKKKKKKKKKKKEGINASEILLLLHCRLVSCVLALKQAYLPNARRLCLDSAAKAKREDVGLQSRAASSSGLGLDAAVKVVTLNLEY